MKLYLFAILNLSSTLALAFSCPNLEGAYSVQMNQIKKAKIQLNVLAQESCQYTNDASTTLFPSMKNWINNSDMSKSERKSDKKLYTYLIKKSAQNNCEYFILNTDHNLNFNSLRQNIRSKNFKPAVWWHELDLKEYQAMDAKTFAINPEGHVQREATTRYGGTYGQYEHQDFIQQQSNGNLLTSYKDQTGGVLVGAIPVMVTYKAACLFKKIQ